MFKLRLISLSFMMPIVIFAILNMQSNHLSITSGIIFICAAWEWIQMTIIKQIIKKLLLLITLILVACIIFYTMLNVQWLYFLSIVWWLFAFIGVIYFPKGKNLWKFIFMQPLIGFFMFVPSWIAFNSLHQQHSKGPIFVLLGCCLIWSADSGAYIIGKLFGSRKLIPNVSPNKTWIGILGALFSGSICMLIIYFYLKLPFPLLHFLSLSIITILFAILGDLLESMLKRTYKYKDSGHIIPGHGGVFDRIDSILSAFPVYVLGLQFFIL